MGTLYKHSVKLCIKKRVFYTNFVVISHQNNNIDIYRAIQHEMQPKRKRDRETERQSFKVKCPIEVRVDLVKCEKNETKREKIELKA